MPVIAKTPEARSVLGVHRSARSADARGTVPSAPLAAGPAPNCPRHLKGTARREWRRVVPLLWEAGLVGPRDTAGLGCYCAALARWVDAYQEIETGGLVIDGLPTPWLKILTDAEVQIARWAQRFGLSTKDRAAMGEALRGAEATRAMSEQDAARAKPAPRLVHG